MHTVRCLEAGLGSFPLFGNILWKHGLRAREYHRHPHVEDVACLLEAGNPLLGDVDDVLAPGFVDPAERGTYVIVGQHCIWGCRTQSKPIRLRLVRVLDPDIHLRIEEDSLIYELLVLHNVSFRTCWTTIVQRLIIL